MAGAERQRGWRGLRQPCPSNGWKEIVPEVVPRAPRPLPQTVCFRAAGPAGGWRRPGFPLRKNNVGTVPIFAQRKWGCPLRESVSGISAAPLPTTGPSIATHLAGGSSLWGSRMIRGLSRFSRSENGTVPFRKRQVTFRPLLKWAVRRKRKEKQDYRRASMLPCLKSATQKPRGSEPRLPGRTRSRAVLSQVGFRHSHWSERLPHVRRPMVPAVEKLPYSPSAPYSS
jgi:hypothetical protein